MSASIRYLDADTRPLEAGWTLLVTEAGRYASPKDVHRPAARIPAMVPGTVAGALSAAGLFDPKHPHPLHDRDAWYFRSLEGEKSGHAILRMEGLSTFAEVYINGELRLSSDSMFHSHDVDLVLSSHDEIAICFRALEPHLSRKGPRARWRPQMMDHQGLRLVRTTPIGHMPGWCPEIHPVGPFRPISLIRSTGIALSNLDLIADLDEQGTGLLKLAFSIDRSESDMALQCGVHSAPLIANADGIWQASLDIPDVAPWWPHTHGKPDLHEAKLVIDGKPYTLGLVGFRRITIDRGSDGQDFALHVNGEKIFCRGAVWTNADILKLSGQAEDYAPWLSHAVNAGMNMIRIGGTMTYESADFFRLCDRLGIMVWQDLIFANFDYPIAEEPFIQSVRREIKQRLGDTNGSPSLAVLCGGSEVYQQGAMLGLPERIWKTSLFDGTLQHLCAEERPDVPFVENSPSGGAMPFSPDSGVTHYYGVGAYCRPLEDARRANVRFAAECLAFANVPEQRTLDTHLPVAAVHHPDWKARVPRDRGASWDFEDIRDHYIHTLYDVDPARLRREDPGRYLQLSRAVTAEVVTDTYAEWRRHGSSCNGALVWTFQDLQPGPGWGVIDSTGEPKSIWYALKRAFRPIQVLLTDEGTNGLDVHVLNETPVAIEAELDIICLRDGRQRVISGKRSITIAPRSSQSIPATDLFGAFFDTPYAFRFGPPSHEVTIASLRHAGEDALLAEAFHFPRGRKTAAFPALMTAELMEEKGQWFLDIESECFAQSVHIASDQVRADDNWFHLAPACKRRIRLISRDGQAGKPEGEITAVGSGQIIRF